MAQLLKKAIMQEFIKLLEEKPMDKITVMDIVARCDISRGGFYYYFQDIYAVFEEILKLETEKLFSYSNDSGSWEENFLNAAALLNQNKKTIYHIYHSSHKEELYRYVRQAAQIVIDRAVELASNGIDAAPEDKKAISAFYRCALKGIFLEWADSGMKEPFDDVIKRFGRLFKGSIVDALKRSAEYKNK